MIDLAIQYIEHHPKFKGYLILSENSLLFDRTDGLTLLFYKGEWSNITNRKVTIETYTTKPKNNIHNTTT